MDNIAQSFLNEPLSNDSQDPDSVLPSISSKYYNIDELNELSPNGNTFSVVHFNTRSLSKQFSSLCEFISSLENSFAVIGISETKLNQNSYINIDMPNYDFLRQDSPTKAGGVGLYVHNSLQYQLRSDLILPLEFVYLIFQTICQFF